MAPFICLLVLCLTLLCSSYHFPVQRWDPEVPYDDRTHMPHWLGSRFTAQESPGKREEYVSPPAAPGALEMRELEQQRRARAASAAAGFQARRGEVEQLGPSVAEVAARDNVVFPGPTLGT